MQKRTPRKAIRISEAKAILGYRSSTTLIELAKRQGWKMWQYNDSRTSPKFVYEADVLAYAREKQI